MSINRILYLGCIILIASFIIYFKHDAKETTQQGDFKVEFLFEHDGCKIYRFKDGSRYVYWVNSEGRIQSDKYRSTGKSGYTEKLDSFTN